MTYLHTYPVFTPPIDGILVKHQKGKKEAWTIGASIGHNYGRFNFTLGHELGHYILHRHLSDNFLCGGDDILGNVKQQKEREREADEFASNLLMPNNSFREQIEDEKFSFNLIKHCAAMYCVSLTAAILKWVELTNQRAIVLCSSEGFIDWAQSSKKAFKSGFFFATKQDIVEVPQSAMAAYKNISKQNGKAIIQPPGVWFPKEEATEYSLYLADCEKTLTVLVFDSYSYQIGLEDEDGLLSEMSFPT